MLHQAMLSNTSFDAENVENQPLFVPFSQIGLFLRSIIAQICHNTQDVKRNLSSKDF